MNYFSECQQCTPPKRYPGCQDYCEAYKKARRQYDVDKQRYAQESVMRYYIAEHGAAVKDGLAKYIRKRPRNSHFNN